VLTLGNCLNKFACVRPQKSCIIPFSVRLGLAQLGYLQVGDPLTGTGVLTDSFGSACCCCIGGTEGSVVESVVLVVESVVLVVGMAAAAAACERPQ